MAIGPKCPSCAKRVPFWRTQWKLGKPFQCAGCQTLLVVPKSNGTMGLGLIVIFWLLRNHFPPEWGGPLGLFGLLILVGLPLTFAATKVRAVEA